MDLTIWIDVYEFMYTLIPYILYRMSIKAHSWVRLLRPLSLQLVGRLPENRLEDRSKYVSAAGGSPKPTGTGPSRLLWLSLSCCRAMNPCN